MKKYENKTFEELLKLFRNEKVIKFFPKKQEKYIKAREEFLNMSFEELLNLYNKKFNQTDDFK